jgi:hypothetical protein
MVNAESIGWAIYAAGFVIWLFGYLSARHAHVATPWGFQASFPTSKQDTDLRSCSRA